MRIDRTFAMWCLFDLFAGASVASAGELWIVGPGPADDFGQIAQAVAAAGEGDTLLVRSGTYASFSIAGKSLAIHADAGADVRVAMPVDVANLGAGQSVRLSGLALVPGAGVTSFPLRVHDCAGLVWLQDLDLDLGAMGTLFGGALTVQACNRVVVENCDVVGGLASFPGGVFPAVNAVQSRVALQRSTVRGGNGTFSGGALDGSPGGNALQVTDSQVWVEGSVLIGGVGGGGLIANPFGCVGAGGVGGTAIVLTGATSLAELHDVVLTPGTGGDPVGAITPCTGPTGEPGAESFVASGVLTTVPGTSRALGLPATVREGATYDVLFEGEPQDLAWLALSRKGGVEPTPLAIGALLVAPPVFLMFAGTLDAAGELSLPVQVGDVTDDALGIYFQGLLYQATEGFVLSSARAVVHLDSSVP